jgi:hypothetical protein
MSKPIPPAVFALRAWTIKESGGKYFIAPTGRFDDREKWSKGYKSLQAACSGIGRKLAEEWSARNARRAKFHRLKEHTR